MYVVSEPDYYDESHSDGHRAKEKFYFQMNHGKIFIMTSMAMKILSRRVGRKFHLAKI
jgi:hypothetical protein